MGLLEEELPRLPPLYKEKVAAFQKICAQVDDEKLFIMSLNALALMQNKEAISALTVLANVLVPGGKNIPVESAEMLIMLYVECIDVEMQRRMAKKEGKVQ